MRILMTEAAASAYGDQLVAVAPKAELVRMRGDGTLVDSSGEIAWEDAALEVAWPTFDLFLDGAPLRPFFACMVRAEGLQWLHSSSAGVDAPIFATFVERGVRLTTTHVTDIPIAEYVIRAVLDHYQQPQRWAAAQAERAWRRHDFREVNGTTWLVIGVGSIGAAVASRARALGARVIGVRRSPTGDEPVHRMVPPASLPDVVPDADVIVLAAPATTETRHLVDDALLARTKPGSLLVNIARGALVDEAALVAAIDRGDGIEAAVLDVMETEPLPDDSPLWAHERITITPHGAAGGLGRFDRGAHAFAENLRRYAAGEPLLHEVRF